MFHCVPFSQEYSLCPVHLSLYSKGRPLSIRYQIHNLTPQKRSLTLTLVSIVILIHEMGGRIAIPAGQPLRQGAVQHAEHLQVLVGRCVGLWVSQAAPRSHHILANDVNTTKFPRCHVAVIYAGDTGGNLQQIHTQNFTIGMLCKGSKA